MNSKIMNWLASFIKAGKKTDPKINLGEEIPVEVPKPELSAAAKERLQNAAEVIRQRAQAKADEEKAKIESQKKELEDFRKVGESFFYCGIEFFVEKFVGGFVYFGPVPPMILAAYKGGDGELKREYFGHQQLPSLIKQNEASE